MVLDLYYDGVNLIRTFLEKGQLNCNGEMLVVDVSNAGFGGDNLLASLKIRWLSEARSFIT